MELSYRNAKKEDAKILVQLYNKSFYDDYIKYGECPAYGRSIESMEASIERFPKHIIMTGDTPIGVLSVENKGDGDYYLGCLCVIPEYQGQGIGTLVIKHMLDIYSDWNQFSLMTPADKEENIRFYTEKCGFHINGTGMDGDVKVVHFLMKRSYSKDS